MFFGAWWVVALAGACAGERWRWADGARAASVRIDTKVRFDDDDAARQYKVQAEEIREPAGSGGTGGFHDPPRLRLAAAARDGSRRFSDGTLDSLQYCKCVSTPECAPRTDLPRACASGMYLCCYKRPNKAHRVDSEYFNEIDNERPMLLPSHQDRGGSFPAEEPRGLTDFIGPQLSQKMFSSQSRPLLIGPDGPTGVVGPDRRVPGVLVGPGGPSGVIGPDHRDDRVLAGPGGPTGVIGPDRRNPAVLVGPSGPSGHIGPQQAQNSGILVGPDGPTGQIGPDETAQRGVLFGGTTGALGPRQYGQRQVLVGPGGPTGLIGPAGRGPRRQAVLAGPDGPTGLVGPAGQRGRAPPGLLVGPGGPTGIIGPGRRILVGPGGPTGQIGPRGYDQFNF